MGIVYEAEQTTLRRRVALKALPPQACRDPRVLDRFRREAQAAARLHHTNIVPVYGVGEHAGIHFYAMQFVDGQPLSQVILEMRRLRRGDSGSGGASVPWLSGSNGDRPFFLRVARLGAQVADALAYAHSQGVIHRDIKPSNLMLDESGTVWVTDFGLAREEGAGKLTRTGDLIGTLSYMAPERFRGWSDPRSDIYSLGLTLYEVLALRPAFVEPDVNRLIRRITDSDLPPLRRRRRNVPRDLETIVLRATARDPGDRYQTASELALDLERFLSDRPIRARRASALQRVRAWSRRNPLSAGLAGLAFVLLVTVAALLGWAVATLRGERDAVLGNLGRAELAEKRLREELRSAQIAEARALRSSRRPGQRFEALDRLAEAARIRPSADLRDDVIATLAQIDVRTLRRWTDGDRDQPHAIDPTTRRYASARPDGEVAILSIADGTEELRLPSLGRAANVACFSPDGRLLGVVYGRGGGAMFRVWDLASRAVVAETPSCDRAGTADFDLHGRAVVGSPDGGLILLDLKGGSTTALVLPEPPGHVSFSADGRFLAAGAGSRSVHIVDPERGVVRTFNFAEEVFDLAWHPFAPRLAVATGPEVRIVAVPDGGVSRVLQGHHGVVSDVAFDEGGSRLVSGSWDRRTVLWDVATGEQLLVIPRFSRLTGPFLRGSAGASDMWLDEIRPSPCVASIDEPTRGRPTSVGFSPDGRLFATACADRVRLWDVVKARELASVRVKGVLFVGLPYAGSMVTATGERIVSWPLAEDPALGLVVGTPETVYDEPPARGDRFPSERDVRFLRRLREAVGPVPLHVGESAVVPRIAMSADGRWVASRVWQSGRIHVWDPESRECVRTFELENGSMAFTPDGSRLLLNPLYGPCKVVETEKWSVVLEFESDPASVTTSRDGALAAAAALPSGVALFRLPGGERLVSLQTEGALLSTDLEFSPDGSRLAVVQPGRVLLWDLAAVRRELDKLGLAQGLPAWR